MQSRFKLIENNWQGFLIATCCLFVVSLAINFQLVNGILSDPFHHGEALAAASSLMADQPGFHPLTIHGALDFIPSLIAQTFFGRDNYFFPTWLGYQIISLFAGIILLAIIFEITKKIKNNFLILLASALIAPSLVGYKDAALLLSIYLYFLIQRKKLPAINILLEVCFGVIVAFGLFWSFDRGIAAAASLGAACIIYAYKSRLYLLSLVVFIVTLILLPCILYQFTLENYWINIKILTETSSQWSYGWHTNTIILTGFLGFSNIMVSWLLISLNVNSKLSIISFPNSIFLIILSIFLFKIGSNRADVGHILTGLWGPLIAGLYWYSTKSHFEMKLSQKILLSVFFMLIVIIGWNFRVVPLIPIIALIAIGLLTTTHSDNRSSTINKLISATLLLPLFSALISISEGISEGQYHWINYFSSHPSNTELATVGVRWASQELLNSGSSCVFDLSNNGVINGLTSLPSCSRFVYPVYANQHYEEEIIDSLKIKQPKAIVYSSTQWSYSIDGKTMPARLPALDKFLLQEYSNEKCSFGYCVRYLTGKK